SLADGTVFDRSPAGQPVRLPVRGVVPGMAEALQEMRPGETRTVYLPPALAYGARGVPGRGGVWRVPPHAVLVFRLTLVRVVP
ncbi:MAG TPA: FKBP-type peptidyl-prolyl cis-trans isomerase, partial [Rubricoccaceae bacterium]